MAIFIKYWLASTSHVDPQCILRKFDADDFGWINKRIRSVVGTQKDWNSCHRVFRIELRPLARGCCKERERVDARFGFGLPCLR
jgi:hypothetical protein